MKTLINPAGFLKAAEYTSKHFFSRPYSISLIADRWFNQLAMVEFENGRILYLTQENAQKNVDIIVDGEVVPQEDIQLIFRFYSQKSEHEKERKMIADQITQLKNELRYARKNKAKRKRELLAEEETKLQKFDDEKQKAKEKYDAIVARGQLSINRIKLESEVKSKIKNIIYRPNHGFGHSVCAAYAITTIQAFLEEHGKGSPILREEEMEKLQLMMLFSVVGRKDETGFADTGDNVTGNKVYASFRVTSGREYLKYCQAHAKHLYLDMESIYRDAIVVELMGYSTIQDALDRGKLPENFIDYVIAKEKQKNPNAEEITREKAIQLINQNIYSLSQLVPKDAPERKQADAMLNMINHAHTIELPRCYPLFKTQKEGPNSIAVLEKYLNQTGFVTAPSKEKLTSFFKLIRYSFDTLALTGQNSMFGFISVSQFESKKEHILQQVQTISDFFKDANHFDDLLKKAHEAKAQKKNTRFKSDASDKQFVEEYCQHLITQSVIENTVGILEHRLAQSEVLNFDDHPDEKKLDHFYELMQSSFDWLACSGNHSLLFKEEYDAKKSEILLEMNKIADKFKNLTLQPILLEEAKLAKDDTAQLFITDAKTDKGLLTAYRNFLIASMLNKQITGKDMEETLKSRFEPSKKAFEFQNKVGDDLTTFDHHQNAVKIVQALQSITPYPGLKQVELPIISAVEHIQNEHNKRKSDKTRCIFKDKIQADRFKNTYETLFDISTVIVTTDGKFTVEVDRKNYQQLLNERLIQFKTVEIPQKIDREIQLVGNEGTIDALSLIKHHRGIARLVSTTALSGENFPDYDYLFRALEDPIHERYTPPLKEIEHFPVDRAHYRDPRTGTVYDRIVITTSNPEIQFQEPMTKPIHFADKIADGWIVNTTGTQKPKNTIYTKKLAHTLLPNHGKVIPFTGYTSKAHNYFPIGVLSDISQVDLKDERYVWAENMETTYRTWIRDPFIFVKSIYLLFNANLDNEGKLDLSKGTPTIEESQLQKPQSKEALIRYLEEKARKFIAKLDEKHYRPTQEELDHFKKLLHLQRAAYIKNEFPGNSLENRAEQRKIIEIYQRMEDRIHLETQRTGKKYALRVRELIKLQKEEPQAVLHNELLVGATKSAVRALYASKDNLFDRLNLAFHAIIIKEKYHYDVPLLVLSQNKSPYHYSEAKIKADLLEAYKLLREGNFPYDRTVFSVYETDDHGGIRVDKKGNKIKKKGPDGQEITIIKNLQAQHDLLVDLFKVGLHNLKHIDQLAQGTIGEHERDEAIALILEKMNVLGGLEREKVLMEKIFSQKEQDTKSREKFFLRAVTLGHQSLVEILLAREDFKPTLPLIKKGIALARTNQHPDLVVALTTIKTIRFELFSTTKKSKLPLKDTELTNQSKKIARVIEENDKPSSVFSEPLNSLKSKHKVKLEELIDADQKLDALTAIHVMSLNARTDRSTATNYLLLLELQEIELAQKYFDSDGKIAGTLKIEMHKSCNDFLDKIRKESLGSQDKHTTDFCDAMSDEIELTKDSFVATLMNLKKLQAAYEAVTSIEMQQVKSTIIRLEKQAKNCWFSWFFGWYYQKKADAIKQTVLNIPLLDRAHLLIEETGNNPKISAMKHVNYAEVMTQKNTVTHFSIFKQPYQTKSPDMVEQLANQYNKYS